MNLNKVFLIGNLTRDPELRSLPSGQAVVNFGLATNRMWKGKDGSQQKQVEFHNIVMFGRLAEITKQYLTKGSMIMVEGRIQTRSWQGQDGQKKQRTEIVAEAMQMGPRGGGNRAPSAESPAKQEEEAPEILATVEYPEDEIKPEDIPF
ncbi:MAG: Single-stranded DNA-binding protein [Candidatus Giovannonibacteria bacterium GW2011_GWC2_44_9]|uniref:Single-stranded DNA-binding protein n=3 Tax=Candidatus Giovannoniibacteriota TaxID=1752738 RepID=A0A0G1L6F8_9BACT|nr:MAG: Single-stranded DNA-binding protein [Candidatus Giovannonibacteria bacterium GW2011_GWB1_44_23]KKT64202.1 MAG: Single-stranded DNA-binding protein [Candidatus Giovannonibacteria bacterium GW2011_GWA1_44_29]KKT84439.1 MAG: Single-stranded DNA-binding protein [Candidatus Giovannonibacteria bacterium GW2011_GWC2_44_9]KKT91803.1 MAG: Single-stranded DNA-binding protein [Parcubacteria group bacterium GW2011_GWC1_45_13]